MILGLDFLQKHNARIYLDLERMRIDEEYIELDENVHIGSIVRLADSVILPPQTKITVEGKVKRDGYFSPGQLGEIIQDERCWMVDEPGLTIANSVSDLDDRF